MISTKDFVIVAAEKSFMQDMSFLRGKRVMSGTWDLISNEHVGISLKSEKTGKVVRFCLAETKINKDGDFEEWVLRPYPADIKKLPALADWKVRIFND